METKHTPGPWVVDLWTVDNKYIGLFNPLFVKGERNGEACVIAEKLYDESNEPTLEEVEANARLIAEAGTVATETGLTPRQLAEQMAELLAALRAFDAGLRDGSIKFTKRRQSDSDPYHPANTLMWKAFAKVEGNQQ